jgi:hypothetical protein
MEALLVDSPEWLAASGNLLRGDGLKPLVLDSSMFESHHVSRHFEQRKRDTSKAKTSGKKGRVRGARR